MILIPMAGLSHRFTAAGYDRPKYMLEAHGESLFRHAVRSFAHYFDTLPFLFVVRDVAGTPAFVDSECRALGVRDARVVVLDAPTRGQAETVALGLRASGAGDNGGGDNGGGDGGDGPVTVFNIDTFRAGFRFPTGFDVTATDGFLEVFEGDGANWSYVRPVAPGSDRVAETAEKRPISDLCCTGLYHFRSAARYLAAFDAEAALPPGRLQGGELYVAPLYNRLIADGADIRCSLIRRDAVIFCGVPEEYRAFLNAR
ncbi:MAG TPA: glycosyltransferase family 2 protein [Azospirillum sp.]|nr:glycosyltransferase family 2 protein [Azospirillum sp.]